MSSSSPPALGLGSSPSRPQQRRARAEALLRSGTWRRRAPSARGGGVAAPLPAVRRDAETGLALVLVVLAVVMSFFLSLTIVRFSAHRALHKLETVANKLAKVPGTLSSLKLSLMEISDLTSQLKNLRWWGKRQASELLPIPDPEHPR